MARQSTQAILRSYGGGPRSIIHADTGLPVQVLAQNFEGPIQMRLSSPANGAHVIGMIPANFLITGWAVLVAGGAGTFQVDLPAYNGLGAVNLVAAATSAAAVTAKAATVPGAVAGPYGIARPITTTTAAGVTGEFNVGLWGIPLDDGALQSN